MKITAQITPNTKTGNTNKSARVEFLSDPELSARWGLKAGTLSNWRCQGRGPTFIKIGGSVRYKIADILAYEDDSARVIGDDA